jgi:hypothetical protein
MPTITFYLPYPPPNCWRTVRTTEKFLEDPLIRRKRAKGRVSTCQEGQLTPSWSTVVVVDHLRSC